MQKVEIITEIAQAHDGSLGMAHSYIDALADTGIDTVKFQMHIAEAESSKAEQFRVNFSYEDKTRFDYWHRMGFTFEQWQELKKHCEDKKLKFLCSPFSVMAFEWMQKLNVERYKIASGEINNYLLVDQIAETGKPILISSGMSNYKELSDCVQRIKSKKGHVEGVFQCTTAYPTPPERYGLNVLNELKQKYNTKIGLSDHSGQIFAPLAACALGAEMLEMHVVFDKTMFGPDSKSSLNIAEIKQLSEGVRAIEKALQNPVEKNQIEAYVELKEMFGKSLALNKDIEKGHLLSLNDLESKKPGNMGIHAKDYIEYLGKKSVKELKKNSFINKEDFE